MLYKKKKKKRKRKGKKPSGSTSRAIFKASELAISMLAGVTARMMELGFPAYSSTIFLMSFSILVGWSPTGTFQKKKKGVNRVHDQNSEDFTPPL